jgi:hypothetical protein
MLEAERLGCRREKHAASVPDRRHERSIRPAIAVRVVHIAGTGMAGDMP